MAVDGPSAVRVAPAPAGARGNTGARGVVMDPGPAYKVNIAPRGNDAPAGAGAIAMPDRTPKNLANRIRQRLNTMCDGADAPPRLDESFDTDLIALDAKYKGNVPLKELKALLLKHLYRSKDVDYDRITDHAIEKMFGNGNGNIKDDSISLSELDDRLEYYQREVSCRVTMGRGGLLTILASENVILVDHRKGYQYFMDPNFVMMAKKNPEDFKRYFRIAAQVTVEQHPELRNDPDFLKTLDPEYNGSYHPALLQNLQTVYEIALERKMEMKKVEMDNGVNLTDENTAKQFYGGVFADFVETGKLPGEQKGSEYKVFDEIDNKTIKQAYERRAKQPAQTPAAITIPSAPPVASTVQ